MFEVVVHTHFASAHNLRGYKGKCEELHGHNWKVAVRVTAETLDSLGMVVDFGVLKKELQAIIEKLDHKYLNDVPPFDELNPSSENIAYFIFQELATVMNREGRRVSSVSVWESESSAATYSE